MLEVRVGRLDTLVYRSTCRTHYHLHTNPSSLNTLIAQIEAAEEEGDSFGDRCAPLILAFARQPARVVPGVIGRLRLYSPVRSCDRGKFSSCLLATTSLLAAKNAVRIVAQAQHGARVPFFRSHSSLCWCLASKPNAMDHGCLCSALFRGPYDRVSSRVDLLLHPCPCASTGIRCLMPAGETEDTFKECK